MDDVKTPPLTTFCLKLSDPRSLVPLADKMTLGSSTSLDKRAGVLTLFIMGAAGDFVSGLRWDQQEGMWEGSQRYLSDTNLDVITAEAIVWIHFLVGRLWLADKKNDPDMFERLGRGTTHTAFELALSWIEDHTGFNFKPRAIERRKLYLEALKDNTVSFEPFATMVLRSVGCQSFAEPLKTIGLLGPSEWTPLSMYVGIFYSTMVTGFYETFKNCLRQWSDRFPHDEDFDD